MWDLGSGVLGTLREELFGIEEGEGEGKGWRVDLVFRSQFIAHYEIARFPILQCSRCRDYISYEINEKKILSSAGVGYDVLSSDSCKSVDTTVF